MEIKEGMYVRTNDGYIGKVVKIEPDYYYAGFTMEEKNKRLRGNKYIFDSQMCHNWGDNNIYELNETEIEDIVKTSDRGPVLGLLDMINVGDYINEKPVECVTYFKDYTTDETYLDIESLGREHIHNFKDIESVVTKERFKRAAYEVKRENQM